MQPEGGKTVIEGLESFNVYSLSRIPESPDSIQTDAFDLIIPHDFSRDGKTKVG